MDGIEASQIKLSDEEVRRARRAYYANVSYFDSKVGELVQTVDEMGLLDNRSGLEKLYQVLRWIFLEGRYRSDEKKNAFCRLQSQSRA